MTFEGHEFKDQGHRQLFQRRLTDRRLPVEDHLVTFNGDSQEKTSGKGRGWGLQGEEECPDPGTAAATTDAAAAAVADGVCVQLIDLSATFRTLAIVFVKMATVPA